LSAAAWFEAPSQLNKCGTNSASAEEDVDERIKGTVTESQQLGERNGRRQGVPIVGVDSDAYEACAFGAIKTP